jgi:hypothetical protein
VQVFKIARFRQCTCRTMSATEHSEVIFVKTMLEFAYCAFLIHFYNLNKILRPQPPKSDADTSAWRRIRALESAAFKVYMITAALVGVFCVLTNRNAYDMYYLVQECLQGFRLMSEWGGSIFITTVAFTSLFFSTRFEFYADKSRWAMFFSFSQRFLVTICYLQWSTCQLSPRIPAQSTSNLFAYMLAPVVLHYTRHIWTMLCPVNVVFAVINMSSGSTDEPTGLVGWVCTGFVGILCKLAYAKLSGCFAVPGIRP